MAADFCFSCKNLEGLKSLIVSSHLKIHDLQEHEYLIEHERFSDVILCTSEFKMANNNFNHLYLLQITINELINPKNVDFA